ncbi:CHH-like protein isoform X2 [Culicoides brevitarsis]|uniref:CHH-like protein isoform X2 n=1 Tax=Culicoides brevitarsis TaxID=469753 RepID=UPI00307B7327
MRKKAKVRRNNKFRKLLRQMYSRNIIVMVVAVATLVSIVQFQQIFALPQHSVARRSTFLDIECKGTFNKSIFYRLDRVCDDCYSLFREPQLHTLCKQKCFDNEYFNGCVEALLLLDEVHKFDEWRDILGRRK